MYAGLISARHTDRRSAIERERSQLAGIVLCMYSVYMHLEMEERYRTDVFDREEIGRQEICKSVDWEDILHSLGVFD